MKILVPTFVAALSMLLGAQESKTVKPPVTKAPPAKAGITGPLPGHTLPQKAPRTGTPRRVVLPPKATNGPAVKVSPRQAPPTRRRRQVVLPPNNSNPVPATRPAPRVVPSAVERVVRAKVPATRTIPAGLTENVSVQLQGTVSDGTNLDLSLTGIGPIFQADVVTGDKHTILTHTYSVKPHHSGYTVEYKIGLRIRMEVARNQQSSSYEFRDVSLNGTVIVKEGAKVVISKNGNQELSLKVSKAIQK